MSNSITCINVASCTRNRLNRVIFISVAARNRIITGRRIFNAVRTMGAISSLFVPMDNRIVRTGTRLSSGPRLIGRSMCNGK